MMVSFTLLDNGLRHKFGHSYAISKAVGSRLAQLNIPYQIFGARSVETDVRVDTGCVPFFSHSLYDGVRPSRIERGFRRVRAALTRIPYDRSPSEGRTNQILNADFEADLSALPNSTWALDNIILFPGLMQHQILGLARFLRTQRDIVQASIICHLMFDHSWLPWGMTSKLGEKTYGDAFRIMKALQQRVHFTTENDHVARGYADQFGVATELLPIPLSLARIGRSQSRRIRIGFLGYSKTEKGFHLLPYAIAACINSTRDLEFVVHINHHGSQSKIREAEASLANQPRVRILRGQLSQEKYRSELSGIDVILLPYDPQYFGMRGSGVLTEAVSCGCVVVASKGTWASRVIELGEAAGEVFEPYNAQSLSAAILRVCDRFSSLKSEASKVAPAWASRNSADAYVEKLLTLTTTR